MYWFILYIHIIYTYFFFILYIRVINIWYMGTISGYDDTVNRDVKWLCLPVQSRKLVTMTLALNQ